MKQKKVSEKQIKNFWNFAVVVAIALAFIIPGTALIANKEKNIRTDTIVSIDPSTQAVNKGETFIVSVYVEPGEPIRGVSFDYLYFNPTLVHANSVTEGDLFYPHNTFFNGGTIDNINGEIMYVYGLTIPAIGVTDPGYFCNISFTAQQEIGTSLLDLEDVIVANESGGQASVAINDGKVAVVWSTTLYFNETSGKNDYVIFGESDDANDGPPADSYDIPKPPEPIPPYIRGWFDDGLPIPYDYLLKDYRYYPDTDKIWDLYVRWESSSSDMTNVTISWDANELNDSEYTSIDLMRYDPVDEEWDFAADMLTEEEYVYSPRYFASDWLTDHFQIDATGGVGNNPPYEPSSPNPSDGATDVSIYTELSWTGGDPDDDPVTYDIYFDTSSPPSKVVSNQTETTYDPGMLEYDTLYYWQIVAWDDSDASNESPIWSFTTKENTPPYQPSSPSPSDGATGVDVNADLGWTGGDPDPGDTVTYDVYFGTTSPPPLVVAGQSGTTYDQGEMNYNTQYYWKIVSWDNHGATTAGPEWSFTTENRPPNTPSNPDPPTGATGVSIDADLSWTGGDPDPGDTVTYDIYFGTTSPPPQVVAGQSGTTYDPGTMEYLTTYYWRIVSQDNHGATTAGPEWVFITEPQPNYPPYAPSDPDPFDGETGVSIDYDLHWTGGDPNGDPVTYDVYFGTSSSPPQVATGISETTYDPGTLEYGTTYYWKIVAWDNHGASNTSDEWEFTTEGEPEPDLDCDGDLEWVDVEPGATVTGEFTVENIGDSGTKLNWKIESYPDWGTWSFDPESGLDLKPEDGPLTIEVVVVAPDEEETTFTGEIKVINNEDSGDYCTVPVTLITPVSQQSSLFLRFLERLIQHFPILERILQLIHTILRNF